MEARKEYEMNLQTTKPRARLMRDIEGSQYWRVKFPCGTAGLAADLKVAIGAAYRHRLASVVARRSA